MIVVAVDEGDEVVLEHDDVADVVGVAGLLLVLFGPPKEVLGLLESVLVCLQRHVVQPVVVVVEAHLGLGGSVECFFLIFLQDSAVLFILYVKSSLMLGSHRVRKLLF